GETTFGKALVQSVYRISEGAGLALTTARYYTPSGRSIQAKGITPDIVVEEPGIDTRAFLREADLDKHLTNDKEKEAAADKSAAKPKDKPKGEGGDALAKPVEFGSDKDYQLAQAVNMLKGLQIIQRN
ncbi:MAG: S41 family peptidase, partial [Burkholderiales bacterium]|nr:S41 family peptidase [Burkholderiales bacterium]